ncbi:hypothetical protein GCM10011414_18870 [Croceivirga lutea]|uniref:hypothetical protein n=1 Tax=Croceivirga lutea TaxID=1775167 RepID=UPI00163A4780|nr:hypothetical protein [Croceivirga lutea]GGG49270.1 hypothetical protein GCM10011414_18870 [Croceivirga lutea]
MKAIRNIGVLVVFTLIITTLQSSTSTTTTISETQELKLHESNDEQAMLSLFKNSRVRKELKFKTKRNKSKFA